MTQLPEPVGVEKYPQASKDVTFRDAVLLSRSLLPCEKEIEGNGSQEAEYQARRLLTQLPFHVG